MNLSRIDIIVFVAGAAYILYFVWRYILSDLPDEFIDTLAKKTQQKPFWQRVKDDAKKKNPHDHV